MFLLQLLTGETGAGIDPIMRWLALWPPTPEHIVRRIGGDFHLWQLITYGFLHGSTAHLAFNMFALWMFGRHIERLWGTAHFLAYYFVCVIGAALVHLTVSALGPSGQAVVGASGGVFGILLAYGLMFPNSIILLIIPPIPMKAKYFVIVFGLVELWLGLTAHSPSIAHFAHLGGMLFGYVLIQYWRGRFPMKPRYILRR